MNSSTSTPAATKQELKFRKCQNLGCDVMISILFHHYKELMECMEQVEHMGVKVESSETASYP